jgi:protein-S-isoprenylcysteine O-methyltransferase Ste14
MTVSTSVKAVKSSAWILYTLIVLEILFMVSPFAAYYYSIYATPLNAFQGAETTAWLTMYVLPHFTYSDSWLVNGLILISWPLILMGIALFLIGFCQIYWSKFTGKGAVEGGLYRHIRHPQYLALAIIGLGCSLYWSRFIVIIAFVTMLYLYQYLARVEERICLDKFGDSYKNYINRTGRFLPKRWEEPWKVLDWRYPEKRGIRVLASVVTYLIVLAIAVGVAVLLREHVVDSLQTDIQDSRVVIYLMPVSMETRQTVGELLDQANLPGDLAYVAPATWSVPELGLKGMKSEQPASGLSELVHPTTHGNALSADQAQLSVVSADAVYASTEIHGRSRLTRALNLRPSGFAELDITSRTVVAHQTAESSQWAGIPVPTF